MSGIMTDNQNTDKLAFDAWHGNDVLKYLLSGKLQIIGSEISIYWCRWYMHLKCMVYSVTPMYGFPTL